MPSRPASQIFLEWLRQCKNIVEFSSEELSVIVTRSGSSANLYTDLKAVWSKEKYANKINFKVQLVVFRVVPFAICTLVPTVLPTPEATLEVFFH
jgi:hypothetical protein